MRPKRNLKASVSPPDQCRVCLSVGADVALFSNVDDTKTATELVKMLIECTSVMVRLDDPLPKRLCVTCVGRLHDAQRLKDLAQSSDKLLHQKYGFHHIEYPPANSEKDASLLYPALDIKQEAEADDASSLENGDLSPVPTHDSSSDYEPPEVKTEKKKSPITRSKNDTKGRIKKKTLQKKKSRIPIEDIKQEHLSDYVYIKGYNENNVNLFTDNRTECKEYKVNFEKIQSDTCIPKIEEQLDNEADVKINKSKQLKKWVHVKKYQCPACPEMFSRKKIYTKHLRRDHKLIKKRFKKHKCHLCPEAFGQRKQYFEHMRNHHKLPGYGGITNYVCHQCGKVFKQSSNLRNHSGCVQSVESQFPCNICGKIFKKNAYLTAHINFIHKKLKPHKCELCPMRFCTTSKLQLHKLHHTGEKPHVCSYCDRRFLRKEVLQRHLFTHTGRKPCSCKHCDQRFSAAGDVKAHVKRMHKGESIAKVSDYCHYIPEESNNTLAVIHQAIPPTSPVSLDRITSQLTVQPPR